MSARMKVLQMKIYTFFLYPSRNDKKRVRTFAQIEINREHKKNKRKY